MDKSKIDSVCPFLFSLNLYHVFIAAWQLMLQYLKRSFFGYTLQALALVIVTRAGYLFSLNEFEKLIYKGKPLESGLRTVSKLVKFD